MADNLTHLLSTSLGFGVLIALLLPLRRALDGRFAPTWWRQVWTWVIVVMCLYIPVSSVLSASVPALIQLDTPQAVVDGAYDRFHAYSQDQALLEAAGSGGGGGTMTMTDGEDMWYRHYVQYENTQGQEVTVRDNDYFRSVTVGDETTYTIHWTGIAFLLYGIVAALLFVGGLVRYGLFRRRTLRWSIPAQAEDLAVLETQKKAVGLDREVDLFRCPLVHTPLLMGFFHPVILLPEQMPASSLDTALAHELTHLKGHDTAQLLWASLIRAIHWFNPMVWLLVRQLHREMELCCDYNLLKNRDEAGRRAYGQAILDQMTAGDRGLSRLTTGFSGDKREVFARFKAMMDTSPKRRGRIALVAACIAVILAGSLVGCQEQADPEGDGAWITGFDLEAGTVSYFPLPQELIADDQALSEWLWGEDGMALEEEQTAPLGPDAQLLHTYEGEAYPLNPTTITYTLHMTQAGALGEVVLDGGGNAVRVQLAGSSRLDLSAPDLDFTGYCGSVYAAGMGGVRFQDGADTLSVDPCTSEGTDGDHTYYTLPLARDADIPEEYWDFLTGLSSARYPDYWQLTVVDGAVTAIAGMGAASENVLDTMSTLQGEDIATISFSGGPVTTGWLDSLDREELAQLVRLAADQPLVPEREYSDEDALDYGLWTLKLQLTDETAISLYAGRAEDQISITESIHLGGCAKLYQLIRTASDPTQVVSVTDPAVLTVMDEALSDTLALWRTPDYAGDYGTSYLEIQLTRLEQPVLPTSLGEGVELYAYDFGFAMDDLSHAPWAGAPWVDSQLRYHPGGNHYLAVERAGDGSTQRWGAFLYEFAPPFDRWEPEAWDAFSASVQSALDRGGVE